QKPQVMLGGTAQRILLLLADTFPRSAKISTSPAPYFHKNQDLSMTADQIDFAVLDQVIATEHPVTVPAQKGGGHPLTIVPDLRCRRQLRRGPTQRSVETIGDELDKVREGQGHADVPGFRSPYVSQNRSAGKAY